MKEVKTTMTGKELILYILNNNLENEEVFKDGKIMGYITVEEAAAKFNVGVHTVYTWISRGCVDYILIGFKCFISDNCEVGGINEYEEENTNA